MPEPKFAQKKGDTYAGLEKYGVKKVDGISVDIASVFMKRGESEIAVHVTPKNAVQLKV